MVKNKELVGKFMDKIERNAADICKASDMLEEGECLSCFIHKGYISYDVYFGDNSRIEESYSLRDGHVHRETSNIVTKERQL
jgi:hypothetical protein